MFLLSKTFEESYLQTQDMPASRALSQVWKNGEIDDILQVGIWEKQES